MNHRSDLATRPAAANPGKNEDFEQGAARLAETLPFGVLVRDERGRVRFINSAACRALHVDGVDSAEMSLTIIRRGADESPEMNVYLLTADQEPVARLVAMPRPLDLGEDSRLELLVLDDADERASKSRATAQRHAAAPRRARMASSPGSSLTPRDLLACAAQRLRRHFRDAVHFEISAVPNRRGDRRVQVDEIAFAEVLLSAAQWIDGHTENGSLELSALVLRHRLRVTLQGEAGRSGDVTLDADRDWLRTIRPFLDSHRATFEVHDDAARRAIVISLPLMR